MENQQKNWMRQVRDDLTSRRGLAYTAVAVACMLAVLLAYAACNGKRERMTMYQNTSEVLDSLAAMLPKGSVVVARFPDETRHCMYYLNSGVLYHFDGKFKTLEEVAVTGYPSGSVERAELTQDEKFIMLTMHSEEGNRLFRLNTENRNVVDLDQTVAAPKEQASKDKEQADEKKPAKPKEEAAPAEESQEEAAPAPAPEREQVFKDVMEEDPA